MSDIASLISMDKEKLPEAAACMDSADIPPLVALLSNKEDKLRYPAFLLLTARSQQTPDVYPCWDKFHSMLKNENSYQRSIGLMLIAENARWDAPDKWAYTGDDYLTLLRDEKPITVRQCIQSLAKILPCKPQSMKKAVSALTALELSDIRETMRRPILTDILNLLLLMQADYATDETRAYIAAALSGGLIDKKTAKEIASRFRP